MDGYMKMKTISLFLVASVLPLWVQAQSAAVPASTVQQELREIAQQAVLKSPEVTTKWHNYKAA